MATLSDGTAHGCTELLLEGDVGYGVRLDADSV